MKELIIQALNYALPILERQVPQTKKKREEKSINDVSPLQLIQFMNDNDIPNDAYFSGTDNGNDGWSDIVLAWEIDMPTTDADKLKYKRKRFDDVAWKFVYELLTTNEYKRVGYSTALLKEFDDTTLYDMYMSKDFDRLTKYYSIRFNKI